jgi:hypothetical protein
MLRQAKPGPARIMRQQNDRKKMPPDFHPEARGLKGKKA